MNSPAPAHRAGAQGAPARHLTRLDLGVGAAAVLMLMIFSQGWIMPLLGETVDVAAGGLVRLVFFPAYLIGLAILVLNASDILRILKRQPFLLLLLGLTAASVLWSINPSETIRRLVAVAFTTAAGVALAARYRWASLAEVMSAAFAILCLASFLLGLGVPSIGRMHELFPGAWRGLWPEKNALGNNMALFFPVFAAAAVLVPERRKFWAGMAGLAFLLLVLSTSKTSLVALMLGLAGMVFIALVRRGPAMAVTMSYAAVVGIVGIACIWLFASDAVFALLGKDATFTGRTQIWSAILLEVDKRPLLGHGYGTVWTEDGRWGPLAWIIKHAGFRPQHAHSSWMEMMLWLGWTGLFAWVALFAQAVVTAIVTAFRDKGAYLALPFLLVYGLISITESITLTYNDLRWVMFVAIACKLCDPDRPERA